MKPTAQVSIGTDQDLWAPPQAVSFDLGPDWVVANAYSVEWRLEGDAHITQFAICWRDGWRRFPLDVTRQVRRRDTFVLPARTIQMTMNLNEGELMKPPTRALTARAALQRGTA